MLLDLSRYDELLDAILKCNISILRESLPKSWIEEHLDPKVYELAMSKPLFPALYSSSEGATAILYAAQYKDTETLEKLLALGQSIGFKDQIKARDENGCKITHYMAANKDSSSLKMTQADLNEVDKLGRAPIHYAALYNNKEAIIYLLEKGADPKAISTDGNTPLHFVSDPELAKILLAHRADPLSKNQVGETPFHNAAYKGSTELIKALLSFMLNEQDSEGKTPMHCATNKETFEFLKVLGADPNIQDSEGKTAEDYAKEYAETHHANLGGAAVDYADSI